MATISAKAWERSDEDADVTRSTALKCKRKRVLGLGGIGEHDL